MCSSIGFVTCCDKHFSCLFVTASHGAPWRCSTSLHFFAASGRRRGRFPLFPEAVVYSSLSFPHELFCPSRAVSGSGSAEDTAAEWICCRLHWTALSVYHQLFMSFSLNEFGICHLSAVLGCAGTANAYLICGFINAILSFSLFLRPLSVSVIFLSHVNFVIISTCFLSWGKKKPHQKFKISRNNGFRA